MSILSFSFWIGFVYFFLTTLIAFTIPGNLFTRTSHLTSLQKYTMGTSLGIVLWALLAFIFGFSNIRSISYIYLGITFCAWILLYRKNFSFQLLSRLRTLRFDFIFIGFAVICIASQLLTTWYNGFFTDSGLYFCCGGGDALYHIALIHELIFTFPPHEPGISNVMLHNYHFLTQITIADLIRVFQLPFLPTVYPYMTFLMSTLLLFEIVTFAQLIGLGKRYTYWLLFFVFFSGGILYILNLFLGRGMLLDLWFLHDATKLWYSPSRFFSTVLFFAALNFLVLYIKKRNFIIGVISAVMFGSLIGFKVYIGIFALVGFSGLLFYFLLKKNFSFLLLFFIAITICLLLYFPINSGAGGLTYMGFWRLEDFIASPGVKLSSYILAVRVFSEAGNWIRVIQYEIFFLSLYLIFVFGTLCIGFFQTRRSLRIFPLEINIFLFSGLGVLFILGFFFFQNTGGANSSQFLITFCIIFSIYAALTTYCLTNKGKSVTRVFIIFFILIITLPRPIYEFVAAIHSLHFSRGILIDQTELSALDYLRKIKNDEAVILINEYNLCLYFRFMSQKRLFFCEDGAPGDRGIKTAEWKSLRDAMLDSTNSALQRDLLQEYTISFIYLKNQNTPLSIESRTFVKKVFENSTIRIYKVTLNR